MANSAPAKGEHATLASYVVGFVLSIVLTLAAYMLVTNHVYTGNALIAAIVALAMVQFLVQLVFFLHLGRETKPRWKLAVFAGMIIIVAILAFGSLWIMANLNYHMTPSQTDTFIVKDEGIHQ